MSDADPLPAPTEEGCPLCGRQLHWPGEHSRPRWVVVLTGSASWLLYGVPVCRRCRDSFASRRQAAFIVDWVLWYLLANVGLYFLLSRLAPQVPLVAVSLTMLTMPGLISPLISPLFRFFFLFKDGLSGMSPGKWLLDVQVVDFHSREPIGFVQSLKRNLPLIIPYVGAIGIAWGVDRGRRWGDRWAGTVVIWRRHAHKSPFDPRGILCLQCGYNLTGNVSGICPECGTPVPAHARTELPASSGG